MSLPVGVLLPNGEWYTLGYAETFEARVDDHPERDFDVDDFFRAYPSREYWLKTVVKTNPEVINYLLGVMGEYAPLDLP